jgi:8-oxo-dGTP diphosphatase
MAANTSDVGALGAAAAPDPRLYPTRPFLAVSLAAFKGGSVLLMARARAPMLGVFTLPGGLVELGESLEKACLREMEEETGVRAEVVGFNDHVAVVERDDEGGTRRHYVVASFVGRWVSGDAHPSAEAAEVLWAGPEDWPRLRLTPGLDRLLVRARRMAEDAAQ